MKQALPRALVVEDDRAWQEILGEILADAGLAVDVAASYDEAVASLRAAPHRLAVVDLSLGGDHRNRDGLRVLDAVRLHDPRCASLLLTGFATVELAVSALTEHGALTCLRKEAFNRAEFRELVRQALASAPPGGPGGRSKAELEGEAPRPPQVAAGEGRATRALLVEDDAGWRSILSELLQEAGYRVRACAGYGEARGCLRRERYALAVVDLSLPGPAVGEGSLDGYRLLAATREASTPTLVVSGVATPDDVERVYAEQGAFACLEKQAFDRRAFLRLVAEIEVARAGAGGELAPLTDRERQVLELLAQGATNKEIAERLVVTQNTVKRHLKAVFEKLGVHTRAAAAAKAIGAGVSAEAGESARSYHEATGKYIVYVSRH